MAFKSIINQYLRMVPMQTFDWKTDQWESEELHWQNNVLKETVQGFISTRYPPPNSYVKAFLKAFIQKLEERGIDIVEDLYVTYIQLLNACDGEENSFSFRTYLLNESQIIVLEESKALVAMGTTGLRTWEAALYLAEWCIRNSDKLANRKILELGCGLGLTGLTVISSCSPRSYAFTDCHSEVLSRLIRNILLNISREFNLHFTECMNSKDCPKVKLSISEISPSMKTCSVNLHNNTHIETSFMNYFEACENMKPDSKHEGNEQKNLGFFKPNADLDKTEEISVIDLNWSELHLGNINDQKPDVILAADVLFDPTIFPDFIRLIKALFEKKRSSNEKCEAYIANALRNEQTSTLFSELLEKNGIMYQDISVSLPSSAYYQQLDNIKLLVLWNM